MSEEVLSKSKAKREARKAEAKASKRKASISRLIETLATIVIAGVVIAVIVMGIINSANKTESGNDFSACLTQEGYIEGANLGKLKDLDLDNLVIPAADVEYSDDELDARVQSLVTSYDYYDDDATLTVEDQSTVNIDYVGYVDDVAFEGGDTQGNGTSLTIGSGVYIDDFEQQLIGYHPGDSLTVNVTFPDPYESNTDLSGKDARFEVVINSIQCTPELTDDFVVEHYSDYGSTVEEFKDAIREAGKKNNIMNYISDYIMNNAEASSYPRAYVKNAKSLTKYSDEQMFTLYANYYTNYLGYNPYEDFSDYTGKTDAEYEDYLKTEAKKAAAVNMTYEKYFKEKGLTISDEVYSEILNQYGENAETEYGVPYLKQSAIKVEVMNYLLENANVQ